MQETDPLYEHVRKFMLEIMAVLYVNGKTSANIGAMMRLIGVPNDTASQYDSECLEIDENLIEMAENVNIKQILNTHAPPAGAIIH